MGASPKQASATGLQAPDQSRTGELGCVRKVAGSLGGSLYSALVAWPDHSAIVSPHEPRHTSPEYIILYQLYLHRYGTA
jgi:hypothetical protein